jgi:UDP-N-acetylmuramoyl-tripeptide--D-alanyl-D-alanine ligase
MKELGEASREEHERIITLIGQSGIDEVWLVGSEFAQTNSPYRTFANVDEVKAALQAHCPEGYTILIKGSNSTRLHQLPSLL